VPRPRSTIAWRLALWFLLLSVLPTAVMMVFVRYTVADTFSALAVREATVQARLVAAAMAASPAVRETLLGPAGPDRSLIHVTADEAASVAWREGAHAPAEAGEPLPWSVWEAIAAGAAGGSVDAASHRIYGYAPVPGEGGAVVVVREPTVVTAPLLRMERASFLQLAVSFLVVAVAGGAAIWLVLAPIRRLTAAAEAIGSGNLDLRIDAEEMEGELAVLTGAFNQMAGQLQASYSLLEEQIADRTRELLTLNQIAAAVGRSVATDAMLADVLRTVLRQLRFEAGAVLPLEAGSGGLRLAHCEGFEGALCALSPWRALAEAAVAEREPLVLRDDRAGPNLPDEALRQGFGTVAFVPLSARGLVEGVLVVAQRGDRELGATERQLLVSIGHQIGVGLQNARLNEQTRQVAVLEERQRLSRDLHDSVTQSLYGVTLYGEAARRLLAAGDAEQGTDYVRQACRTAQAALQEMRLLIFELRPSVLQEQGLVGALTARLEQVEGRAGTEAAMEADEDLVLDDATEEALYRVAQEALNNALKHAHARRVKVSVRQPERPGPVFLRVEDDGGGMELDRARLHGGMGLRTMAERVEMLGGSLAIDSAPGEGTVVRVELPDRAPSGS